MTYKLENKIDFSGIYKNKNFELLEEQPKGMTPIKDILQPLQDRIEIKELINTNEREKRQSERERRTYIKYQEAIKKTEHLKTEVMKGTANGIDLALLLTKACKCLAILADDEQFYNIVTDNINTIYGKGYQREAVQVAIIEQLEEEAEKLKQALDQDYSDEEKKRIKSALLFHQKEIEKIKNFFQKK